MERLHPTPNLEYTLEIALHRSDRDEDNPLRRLWHPEMVAPQEAVHGWEVPPPPRRINVNRVVAECLHCDQYELRGTTLHYLRGQMRDQGGYHTTHALWALLLAEERACLPHGVFSVVARELVTELVDAQPQRLAPRKTIDLDLFAERLLFVQMARQRLNVAAAPQHAQWVERLVEHQHEDGGIYVEPEPAAQAYHATMMTAWALAQWLDARPM